MKALLLFPMQDKQSGLFIKRALEQLCVSVVSHDSRARLKARVPALVKKHKPDFILCNREHGLYKHIVNVRSMSPRPKLILWNLDKRQKIEDFGPDLLKLFNVMDTLYTVALGDIPQYERLCPNTEIKHLQQGIDPLVHRTEILTDIDHVKYDCEVMFAGSFSSAHRGRVELFEYLSKSEYQIKHYHGKTAVFDAEHNKACQCAKVCLGHNGVAHLAVSMSVRDYKIMGAGGVLLTQWCPGIEKWFTCSDTGVPMCYTFKSKEECVEKIRYILAHYDEAKERAAHAQREVHARHRYIDRVQLILKDVKKAMKGDQA
jgi:hypothetical protein